MRGKIKKILLYGREDTENFIIWEIRYIFFNPTSMVGELVFNDLAVPSHNDRVGQVSHHKVGRLYADPTATV
jgi:hypothetical protein